MARIVKIICFTVVALSIIPAYTAAGDRVLPRIAIESIPNGSLGSTQFVSLTTENSIYEMGGFDFLIAYDVTGLTFTGANPGQLLTDCDWEYYTYRTESGDCGEPWCSGLVRVTAVAETNNGPFHPSCYGPPDTDSHELAEISFYVTEDLTFEGQYIPIYFFWSDCGDNSISSVDGYILFVDLAIYDFDDSLIWNEEDDDLFPEEVRIPYVGASDSCLFPERFVCGDANGDGAVNVADAVMVINYVFKDGPAPVPLGAGDANDDGTCNVGDAVYHINHVFKDGPAPICPPVVRLIEYQHGGIYIPESKP